MNTGLRKITFIVGIGILGVSIFWSQEGFNFKVAGDSGDQTLAIAIGWFLAVAFSVLQFVFSSNFKELNMSLILLGLIAYGYSIYTNYAGITNFQGTEPNTFWAWALAFFLDATAEPAIAWSLGVSREGDFLGNIVKTIVAFFNGIFNASSNSNQHKHVFNQENAPKSPQFRPLNPELAKKLGKNGNNGDFENILHGVKSKKHSRFE